MSPEALNERQDINCKHQKSNKNKVSFNYIPIKFNKLINSLILF